MMRRVSPRTGFVPFGTAVFLGLLVTPPGGAAAGDVGYDLILGCPEPEAAEPDGPACSSRIEDELDILGSPSIVVDPRNARHLILASLHGSDADGPSERSRASRSLSEPRQTRSPCLDPNRGGLPCEPKFPRGPFTTFVSKDGGASWSDTPHGPPRHVARDATGEHPQVAMHSWGNVYVGSLYASPDKGSRAYTIVAQKFGSAEEIPLAQDGNYYTHYLRPIFEGNIIDQFWFVHDAFNLRTTIVWSEHVPARPVPSGRTSIVDENAPVPPSEFAAEAATGAAKGRSVIGMAWTTTMLKTGYTYIPAKSVVGPCAKTTNPVFSEGFIYVGCVLDPAGGEYPWGPVPEEGRIDLFRFDSLTYEAQFLGPAPVKGGNPRLALRSDGRLALVLAGVTPQGETQLVGVWSKADKKNAGLDWGPVHRFSGEVSTPRPGFKVVEANVQDVVFREQSGALHLILKERLGPTTAASASLIPDLVEAESDSRYTKSLVALHDEHGVLARVRLDIGNPTNRKFVPGVDSDQQNPHGVFNDLADDILQLPPAPYRYKSIDLGSNYQREFLAVGDYGTILFAELTEITNVRVPGTPSPPAPAVPLIALAGSAQLSLVLSAVGGGALAGLMTLRLALNRSKNTAAVVSKAGP